MTASEQSEPVEPVGGADLVEAQPSPKPPGTARRGVALLRTAVVWSGLATFAALSVLAGLHLLADLDAVLGIRGGWSAVAGRLAPVAVLAGTALLLTVLVAWLAGGGRRREMAAISIGVVVLLGIRIYLSSQFDSGRFGEPGVYLAMAESFLTPEWDFAGRPMAYSVALAGAFALTADRQLGIEAVNLLLAVLAGVAVLGLARGLYGARAGSVALLAYAMWPAAALMTVVSIPQIAFDLAVVAAAWAAVALPPGWRGSALTGAIVGLAQYLRPTAPVLLPAYVLARLWSGGSPRQLLLSAIVPVVFFVLVLTPVMVYNLGRTGSASISTSDYGGHSLYIGTYEPSGGRFSQEARDFLVAQAGPDVLARSELGMELALQRIRDDPVGIAALAVRKQDTLWGTEHYGVQYGIKQSLADRPQHPAATTPLLLSQGFYVLVLVAATAGLWLRRRQPDALIPLAITMVWTVSAVHALLEVRDRHHSYVIPLLLPLAAIAVTSLLSMFGRHLRRLQER